MLKKIFLLFLLPMLCNGNTQANNYCHSYCDSQWEIYADWLYWKPRSQSLDYATFIDFSSGLSVGNVIRIEPSYQSGFRVGVFYECNDLFYDLFYVRFHQNFSDDAANNFLASTRVGTTLATFVISPFIRADWSFAYDTVDLIMGTEIYNNCSCFLANFFGGLKLVFIDQTYTTNFTNISSSSLAVTQKNNLDGYGVDCGIGMEYNFWDGLHFFTRTSTDVFLAKFHRTYDSFLTSGTVIANSDDDYWNVVSAINVMLGLAYDYNFKSCWCSNLGVAVGYEFHQYFGISDWLAPFVLTGGGLARDLQNLSLDGLFVRASFGF